MKKFRNWLLFAAVILLWGFNWPIMKSALVYVDPMNLVFQRFLFATFVLSPILILHWKRIPRDKKSLLNLVFLGIIGALFEICVNLGLTEEKSGIGSVLTYTQPFFVFFLAIPLLEEKIRVSKLIGISIGFSGVVVLSWRGSNLLGSFSVSAITLVIGAFLWALQIVYYKKSMSNVDPVVASIFQLGVGAVVLAMIVETAKGVYLPLSLSYLPLMLYYAIGATATAATLWLFVLREEEATVVSSSSLVVPLISFFFGWLLLGENLDLESLIGAIGIFTGLYLVNRKNSSNSH